MVSGVVDGNSKKSPEEEEQRLRERLKRRKEDRHRPQERDRRRDGHPPHHPPPRGQPHGRGPQYFPRGPPAPRDWRGGPPPRDWRGPPRRGRSPPVDRYNGGGGSRRSRSYSRSRSRSDSRGRSRSASSSSRHSSRSSSSDSSRSADSRSRSRSASASSEESRDHQEDPEAYALTKDQRTVFVSQLVMRADEKDIRRYFRKTVGCKVNDVAMLRDKRTGRHKGSAYVELGRIEDVVKAIQMSNQAPDFQRFPILVKPSEAEKNYIIPSSNSALTASMMGIKQAGPMVVGGKLVEAQKAYVGNLHPSITQEQIFTLFACFGSLEKVMLQTEPTGVSKGFCFLSYRDPKDANLAIQTLAGQMLIGKPLKTGWANQTSTVPGVEVVTSYEFPDDAPTRIQAAHLALSQLADAPPIVPPSQIDATAEAAINAALGLPPAPLGVAPPVALELPPAPPGVVAPPPPLDTPHVAVIAESQVPMVTSQVANAKVVGGADSPTTAILVRNMFDKDEETEPNWEEEIRLDFEEECSKYGKLVKVVVMHEEEGGKIFAAFETVDGAKTCAFNLAGRWFDKRQLRVEFVPEESVPPSK